MSRSINCPQCGATMTQKGNSAEFECPYCGETKYIVEENESPEYESKPIRPVSESEVKYVLVERESKPDFHSSYGDPNFKYDNKSKKSGGNTFANAAKGAMIGVIVVIVILYFLLMGLMSLL